MTKTIRLNNGTIAFVSDSDYGLLSQRGWSQHVKGYAVAKIDGRKTYMHRLVLGAQKGQQVDHINGNKLDNRRENLRLCTDSQNRANAKLRSDNTSGYKGVRWNSRGKWWDAFIKVHGRQIRIGRYTSAEAAARAYDVTAMDVFGEFAKTNQDLGNYIQYT